MKTTLTAALIAVHSNGKLLPEPSSTELNQSTSIHVLAFSSQGNLLLVESEGDFSIESWEEVLEKASIMCHGKDDESSDDEDASMTSDENNTLEAILRTAIEEKVAKERRWKGDLG